MVLILAHFFGLALGVIIHVNRQEYFEKAKILK